MSFRLMARAVAGLVFACGSLAAQAQQSSSPDLEYNRLSRPSDSIAAFGNNLFGEQADLYNGQTSFDITDISIPGTSKLPVALGRHLDVAEPDQSGVLPSFGNWEVDVPYLQAYYSSAGWMATTPTQTGTMSRCSVAGVGGAMAPDIVRNEGYATYTFYGNQYFTGINMRVPGTDTQELLVNNATSPYPSTGGSYHWITKNLWSVSCLPTLSADTTGQGGEGFLATSPDGTKYYFDVLTQLSAPPSLVAWSSCVVGYHCPSSVLFSRNKYFLLASRVVDRFGNWVHYSYNGNQLASITSNDGREIDVSWGADGNIQSAVAINPSNTADRSRTWTYTYMPSNGDPIDNPNTENLAGVAQPDGSFWGYRYTGSLVLHRMHGGGDSAADNQPDCQSVDPTPVGLMLPANSPYGYGAYTLTATSPSGEQGVFQFQPLIRGLSNDPYPCTGVDPNFPWTRKQFAIMSKTLSDPTLQGNPSSTWAYTYSPPNQSWAHTTCNGGACPTSVWTDVAAPDGTHVRSTFG
ncbi:MAG: hypothetical protein JSR34_01520, partial [Proteobacteria bacterium]|nr:hypothetical protein [Pseudomonadota bacterium]